MWGGGSGRGGGGGGGGVGGVRVDVNEELKFWWGGSGWGGGQGGCERRIEVFAKIKKTRIDVYETLCPQQMLVHKGGKIKNWGGECRDVTPTKSLSQNIRVDVNREVKFL